MRGAAQRGTSSAIVFSAALALVILLAAGRAQAADDVPLRAACDAEAHATTLVTSSIAATQARAHWIDRKRIVWPGIARDAQVRLLVDEFATGSLSSRRGQPIALRPDPAPLSAERVKRFRHLDTSVVWRLPDDVLARLPRLLQGELRLEHIDVAGRIIESTRIQLPGVLDDVYAGAATVPLGIAPSPATTRFSLWAPTARDVHACVYRDGDAASTSVVALARDTASGIWTARVAANLSGQYATYLVDVVVPGTGLVRNRVTDPYSVSLTTDSTRTLIADLDDATLKPAGWDAHARPAPLAASVDMAIYELHVRDFSIGDASVPDAHRGKYLGFTHATGRGMRHLRRLREAGMTDIHLLPVFDIATIPERGCVRTRIPDAAPDSDAQASAALADAARDCFNWGYDPLHYTAPEGSYATDARDGAVRIREFRSMVMALHAAGLRVGMDVVYNHTSASGQASQSVLDRIVPGYYHRLDADGAVTRSTCCDNTATEHAMMGRLMRDSVATWARDHAIDSFRFDLMGHQPRDAMLQLQRDVDAAAKRHVELIGEGWNFGEVADGTRFVQAAQRDLAGTGIGTFSDRARDALRGGGCCDSGRGLLDARGGLNGAQEAEGVDSPGSAARAQALRNADLVRVGLAGTLRDMRMVAADGTDKTFAQIDYAGGPAGYAAQPGDVVNYVENHDNPTLWDLHAMRLPRGTPPRERARVQLLGAATTALSQGIAYFHAGIDVLRSKSLDRNSFDSGDWFNRLDWTYTDNGFGAGLPPTGREDWPLLAPVLRDASATPRPAHIAWMRDAFADLLRIRASSTLLRLRKASDVMQRLRFHNTGPAQDPALIVATIDGRPIDGRALEGANFDSLMYAINVGTTPRTLDIADVRGIPYVLHPVQRRRDAADDRPRRQARFDIAKGRITVPARTVVVWVVEPARR